MDWHILAQQLVNGLTLGSIYGLIAIGYTMVYGIIGMINFAHGDIFMIGGFIALISFLVLVSFGLTAVPLILLIVLLVSMAITALYGWTVERVAYRPLRGGPRLVPLISAIGMSIFLQNYVQLGQGARDVSVPPLLPGNLFSVEIGGFPVSVQPLTHPGGAFAYRVHGRKGDLCYVTDHEFGNPAVDEPLLEFCRGCAALISDAHFTPEELVRHRGWGHGDWRRVAEFASQCGAGRLFLFHHKPGRTDAELTQIVGAARRVFAATDAACEGLAFEI